MSKFINKGDQGRKEDLVWQLQILSFAIEALQFGNVSHHKPIT
jgi:hypothetical protein